EEHAGEGPERRCESCAPGGVEGAVRNADTEQTAISESLARGDGGCTGIGQLVETVPECDGVELRPGVGIVNGSRAYVESAAGGERIGGVVHVDAGEGPADSGGRGEESAYIAADLEPATGAAAD